eukprot:610524-Prorocentrum_lima.AAC.1
MAAGMGGETHRRRGTLGGGRLDEHDEYGTATGGVQPPWSGRHCANSPNDTPANPATCTNVPP